jgi:hypothetical protein
MGPDELNLNSAPDDALSAGVAENLVATAPGIELPKPTSPSPFINPPAPAPPPASTRRRNQPPTTSNRQLYSTQFGEILVPAQNN